MIATAFCILKKYGRKWGVGAYFCISSIKKSCSRQVYITILKNYARSGQWWRFEEEKKGGIKC
jgi:hypothetical protein